MKSIDEQILRTTKEIIVKFIEMGRLSPSNIHESFRDIHTTVNDTVRKSLAAQTAETQASENHNDRK
ncbi:MAG TPA: conjugal transfer protein TraB [Desulfobacteraceae bacterium]|nr:conjugal transfer protein TraB [Desulfobacteraceae bacterium]